MATDSHTDLRNVKWQNVADESALASLLGTQGEIWLAVRTDGKAGSGTRSDPFDASTATKYTTLLTTYNLNYVFMYHPGLYFCLGWNFDTRKTMNAGCKHYTPFGEAVIKLACTETGPGVGTIFGCNYNDRCDGFEIDGLTLDCDATNQAKWATGAARFVTAIEGSGSNIRLRNFKVTGFGTNSVGTEAFPVFLGNSTSAGAFENNLIEHFTVISPATGNQDGTSLITCGVFNTGQTSKNNIIRFGTVDVYGNDFTYSHGPNCLLVENNFVRGCSQGFYSEPVGSYYESPTIRGNKYQQCSYAVNYSSHTGSTVESINIENNLCIDCSQVFALDSDDGNLARFGDVTIRNNRAIFSDGSVNAGTNAIYVTSATNVTVANNIADFSGNPSIVVKATNASVAENRQSNGTLLNYALNTVSTTQKAFVTATSGGDFSSNTASSVDSEIVVFSGTGGKTGKRATGSGIAKLTSGVLGTASAGTDYVTPTGSGAGLTALNAAALTTNLVPTARLGSGTANNTTFLRGDQAWAGVSGATIPSTTQVLIGDGAGNATTTTETGTGNTVRATSPSLTTPNINVATATSVNKWSLVAPTTAASLTAGADNCDYVLPGQDCNIGFREIPQNSRSAAYTTVLADNGKEIFHPASDANARTFTIDSNANVAQPIGAVHVFTNLSANNVTIAITSDTMYLLGSGTTGSRTLAQYGQAVARKVASTTWVIGGIGLT